MIKYIYIFNFFRSLMMNLAILSQLPKLTAFLKGQHDTVYKQMWDYTFQLILYSQVQFSNFTRGSKWKQRFLWTGAHRDFWQGYIYYHPTGNASTFSSFLSLSLLPFFCTGTSSLPKVVSDPWNYQGCLFLGLRNIVSNWEELSMIKAQQTEVLLSPG